MKPVLTFDGRLSSMPGSPPILANALQFLSDLPDSNGSTISSMADEYASDDEKYGAFEVELQSAQPIPFASRGPGRFNAQYPFRAQAQRSRPGPSVWTALKLRMSSSFEEKGGSEDLVVRESHAPQRALLPTPKYAPPSLRHFGPRTAHDTFFSGRPTTGTKPKEVTFKRTAARSPVHGTPSQHITHALPDRVEVRDHTSRNYHGRCTTEVSQTQMPQMSCGAWLASPSRVRCSRWTSR